MTSDLSCLICDENLEVSDCINVFCVSLPQNGELLATFVSRVVQPDVPHLQGSHVCSRCYNLLQMLEQAEATVASIRCEILKLYELKEKRIRDMKHLSSKMTDEIFVNENKMQLNFADTEMIKQPYSQDFLTDDLNDPNENINDKIIIMDTKESKRQMFDDAYNEETVIKSDFTKSLGLNVRASIKDFQESVVVNNSKIKSKSETYLESQNQNDYDQQQNYYDQNTFIKEKDDNEIISKSYRDKTNDINEDSVSSETKLYAQEYVHPSDNKCTTDSDNIVETREDSKSTEETNQTDQTQRCVKQEKNSKYSMKPLKYSCSTCGKKWRTSTELKTHIKTHSSLRPYMCEKCGQAYKHKHALKVHVGMHDGINPFQCSFCNKCFTQKGALIRHLPMHTGEMPYQCELCGKKFVHHTSYNMHLLSHSGKKSYHCHICDLALLSTSHLKRHMRVHTGERPYSCSLCGKRFAERYNLLAHQKIHEVAAASSKAIKERLHKCPQCELAFYTKHKFTEHVNRCCDSGKLKMESHTDESTDPMQTDQTLTVLENSLPQITSSTVSTLDTERTSLESINYDTNLQIPVEPTGSLLLDNNHV